MRFHISFSAWTATFFAVLGVAPTSACGGSTAGDTSTDTDPTTSDGGPSAAGAGSGGETGDGGFAGAQTGGDGGTSGGAGGAPPGGSAGVVNGGSAGVAGAAGAPPTGFACVGGQPMLGPGGEPNGYVLCDGGWMHRPERGTCESLVPRTDFTCPYTDPALGGDCMTDADCTAAPYGRCGLGAQIAGCFCTYGCTRDEECGAGQICLCGDPVGECVAASCRTNADCGGLLCASYIANPHCGGTEFACQTPSDVCMADADCGGNPCTHDGTSRICQQATCVIGRPFLVRGEERLAPLAARSDWQLELAPCLTELDAAARHELGIRWARIGQMEHASIGAFARFALELLMLGAPPDLIQATQQAMADETRHALLAYGLASVYAGRKLGPGPLDVEGSLERPTLLGVVRTTFIEGCIGETVAAMEAAEALARAADPAVRSVLTEVARDERRHAELAWCFLRWALAGASGEERRMIARIMDEALENEVGQSARNAAPANEAVGQSARNAALANAPAEGTSEPMSVDGPLVAHGVLPEPMRAALRRRVVEEVVRPCAAACLRAAAEHGVEKAA